VDRSVLIIDDEPSMLEMLRAELERREYKVVTQTSPEAALRALADSDFGVVLSDLTMNGMSGVDLCREVVLLREDVPVVVMTAFASIELAIASIRAGAYDFVTKPFDADDLVMTIERALRHRELREEVKRLRRTVNELQPFAEMIGESAAMKKMYQVIARVAESDATVLVSGESGTGKELVARAIHARSPRASGPFVAINCAAMPEPLLESELFGHVKGAFTDARATRAGLFSRASGGTLFLDEIAEMPLGMQAKLLRALQERTVRPVGGDAEVPFDARIVAATNRDLELEVEHKRFREDLFYRVNVVHIAVPPLRTRENDVLLLAQTFLQRAQPGAHGRVVGIKSAAAERLASYPWPGNVRELQNCIQRAVALAQFDHIGVDDLTERIGQYKPSRVALESMDPSTFLTMEEMELRYIRQVLDALGGNKASAARVLGMDRRTLYRKLERWSKDGAGVSREDGARRVEGASPTRESAAC
jgi:DNA-binding NtrC family response regulator